MGHWVLGWAKGWRIFVISLLTLELCLQGREHVWPRAVLDRRRRPCFLGSRQTGHILLVAVALLTYSLTYIFWLRFRDTAVVPLVAWDKLVVQRWVQGTEGCCVWPPSSCTLLVATSQWCSLGKESTRDCVSKAPRGEMKSVGTANPPGGHLRWHPPLASWSSLDNRPPALALQQPAPRFLPGITKRTRGEGWQGFVLKSFFVAAADSAIRVLKPLTWE